MSNWIDVNSSRWIHVEISGNEFILKYVQLNLCWNMSNWIDVEIHVGLCRIEFMLKHVEFVSIYSVMCLVLIWKFWKCWICSQLWKWTFWRNGNLLFCHLNTWNISSRQNTRKRMTLGNFDEKMGRVGSHDHLMRCFEKR